MKNIVHYHIDGTIVQVTRTNEVFEIAGYMSTEFTGIEPNEVTPRTHVVEEGVLRAMTEAERAIAGQPTLDDMKILRCTELTRTDVTQIPDTPVPPGTTRAQWTSYRQALRDLGQHASARQWAVNWPVRPDGVDASLTLKSKFVPPV